MGPKKQLSLYFLFICCPKSKFSFGLCVIVANKIAFISKIQKNPGSHQGTINHKQLFSLESMESRTKLLLNRK